VNKIISKISIILIFLISISIASAVQVSLMPATVDVPNMVQGGYYEVEYILNVNSDEETPVTMELDESPINEWITFEPNETEFFVSKINPKKIKMIIEPPESVANGNYLGGIRFSVKTEEELTGQTSVVIQPGLVSKLNISIISNRITDCRIIDAKIEDVEIFNNLKLDINTYNNGNIDAKPEIKYEITNKNDEVEIQGTKNDEIVKPTQRKIISKEIEQSLKPGQYFIKINVPNCQDYSKILTFDILEWGATSSKIEFTNLYPENVWNNEGDKIKLYALAKNTGTKLIKKAQFVGKIELNNQLIEVIASKSRQLIPGEEIAFEHIFIPKESGRYTLTGTIQYDDKESFEKTAPINVNPKEKKEGITTENIFLFLAIAIVIALLLITYIRKRE